LLLAAGAVAAVLIIAAVAKSGWSEHPQAVETKNDAQTAEASKNEPAKNLDVADNQADTEATIVRNGVTVVTPHLLVPVIPADGAAMTAADAGAASSVKSARHTARNHVARHRARFVTNRQLAPWFNPVAKRVARF
jgi:hypothetical protein